MCDSESALAHLLYICTFLGLIERCNAMKLAVETVREFSVCLVQVSDQLVRWDSGTKRSCCAGYLLVPLDERMLGYGDVVILETKMLVDE
jgi:hypothetical protein